MKQYVLMMRDKESFRHHYVQDTPKGNTVVFLSTDRDLAKRFNADDAIFFYNYYRPFLTTIEIQEVVK